MKCFIFQNICYVEQSDCLPMLGKCHVYYDTATFIIHKAVLTRTHNLCFDIKIRILGSYMSVRYGKTNLSLRSQFGITRRAS